MKMPIGLYNELVNSLKQVKNDFPTLTLQYYVDNKLGKDHNKRWRWDMFWKAKFENVEGNRSSSWVCDKVYPLDMNDSHLDTALRKATKEVWNL